MAPTFDIVATAPDRVRADLLAVPVFTGGLLGPGADIVDQALGGTLAAFMTEAGFEAKRGEALAVPTGGRLGAKAAVLVGMGERDTLDADALRRAGAAVARRASKALRSGAISSSRTSRTPSPRSSRGCRCSAAPTPSCAPAWPAVRESP